MSKKLIINRIANSKRGGNPLWIKGGLSPNPSGRKRGKNSVRVAVGKFLTRNLTHMKLQKYMDHLDVKDQIQLLFALLPYHLNKETNQTEFERLPEDQLNDLYIRAMSSIEGQFFNKMLPGNEFRNTKP